MADEPVADTPTAPPKRKTPTVQEPSRWRYVGPTERVYTHVPVTVVPGDVIDWPELPAADGGWEQTADSVTKRPDNYRPPQEG